MTTKAERKARRVLDEISREMDREITRIHGRLIKGRIKAPARRELNRMAQMEYQPLTRRLSHV